MFSRIYSAGTSGIQGRIITVEVDSHDGLPGMSMVGYLSSEVREAQERVRTALKNSGFSMPPKKTVINLSPASIRKAGTSYDLAIALGVLGALEYVNLEPYLNSLFVGELGLDGTIKPVRGVLPMVLTAKEEGFCQCFLPPGNEREGQAVRQMEIAAPESLKQCVEWLRHPDIIKRVVKVQGASLSCQASSGEEKDFSEVNGQ